MEELESTVTTDRHFEQRDVRLQSGVILPTLVTAYRTRGTLSADGRNAVLVAHGYTGGMEIIEDDVDSAEGTWGTLIGPGRPIDTNRYFVVCANALGSSYGSTNAASIDPATGRQYGSRFPDITVSDIVAGQRALMDHLGVKRLVAVMGPSFGGVQVFQWGVDHPDFMDGLVPVIAAPAMPNVNVAALEAELAAQTEFHGGDYYGRGDMTRYLTDKRIGALQAFGIDAVLAERIPDPERRRQQIAAYAQDWARTFDANSLLVLFRAMAAFDVRSRLGQIRVPVLYVLSRTDRLIPPAIGPAVMDQLKGSGVDARYFEIDSEHGHFASGADAAKWASALRAFLAEIDSTQRPM